MTNKTGFLLAEDQALKLRFSGLTVSDDKNATRPVQVFFRYPEAETERTYPFITIEHIDIVHAKNRQHSENNIYYKVPGTTGPALDDRRGDKMTYWPSVSSDFGFAAGKQNYEYLLANEHVPVDLLYQISTFTRTALHDRELSGKLLVQVLPFRRGFIEIPADNTIRRLDLLDWTTADLLDPEAGYRKRIFRKVYTVQMTAEIPSSAVYGQQGVATVVGGVGAINRVVGGVRDMVNGVTNENISNGL
jgi:hypothetical protein